MRKAAAWGGGGGSFGFELAHCFQNVDADFIIQPLLFVEGRLVDVDQRRSIDVDVVEASVNRLVGERFHCVNFGCGVSGELLRAHLEVVALNEDWTAKPFS